MSVYTKSWSIRQGCVYIILVGLCFAASNTERFQVDEGKQLLVEDSSGTSRRVNAPIVKLKPGTYELSVTFGKVVGGPTGIFDDEFLGRVLVQKRNKTGTTCDQNLCWVEVSRFTSRGISVTKRLTVEGNSEWLITSWHLTNSKSRGGESDTEGCGQDRCWKAKAENIAGRATLKLSFTSPQGDTVVTVTSTE